VKDKSPADKLRHYIDDSLLVSKPVLQFAHMEQKWVLNVFHKLGVPIAMNKLEGPVTSLIFLGIVVDSLKMEVRLAEQRLKDLQEELTAPVLGVITPEAHAAVQATRSRKIGLLATCPRLM